MDSMDQTDLKTYLTEDFGDKVHKKWSLLDIYRNDVSFFNLLLRKKKIRPDAAQFFSEKEKDLIDAEAMPTYGFRKFAYEQIIERYVKEKQQNPKKKSESGKDAEKPVDNKETSKEKTNEQKDEEKKELDKDNYPNLLCPHDLTLMKCKEAKMVHYKHKKTGDFPMPVYECKTCKCKYTMLDQFPDMEKVYLNGTEFINTVLKLKNRQKYLSVVWSDQMKHDCYVQKRNKFTECLIPGCNHHKVISIYVNAVSKKGKSYRQVYKICPNCGTFYMSYSEYVVNEKFFECKNLDEFLEAEQTIQKKIQQEKENDIKKKKSIKQPEKEPVKQSEKEPIKQPKQEPVKQPEKEPVKQSEKEPIKQPKKEPVKQPEKEPVKQPEKEPVKQPEKEPIKQPKKEEIKQPEKEVLKQDEEDKKCFPKLICPYDLEVMSCIQIEHVKYRYKAGSSFAMPVYKCTTCGRIYTRLYQFNDMYKVHLNNKAYINLLSDLTQDMKKKRPVITLSPKYKRRCYVYETEKINKCRMPECAHRKLVSIKVNPFRQNYKICPNCGMLYASYPMYNRYQSYLKCSNLDDLLKIKKKLKDASINEKKEQEHKKKREKEKFKKNHVHDTAIHVKDFVVRRNVFKCRHDDHKLQNINASISLINSKGDVIQSTIPAGYCATCNIFFIMESVYENLKRKGTPICRISDEKSYLKGYTSANGMRLAQQSILMQYGYNVSQAEGLTEMQRHKILAIMIDHKILTNSEIISYLDFFISQRQSQSKFERAIAKWELDRDFVEEYHKGNYATFGVGGIYKNY